MSIVNLYNNNIRGFVGFIGSPLGTNNFKVIAPTTTPIAGGTVISTLPDTYGSVFSTWNNTTGGWSNWNPSSAIIPSNSKVEYAFLVWSTAYYPPISPTQEVLANTLPITFIKPDDTSYKIAPNPSYNLNYNAGWWQYTHGADVTTIVSDNQYGNYEVLGVPTGSTQGSWGLGAWGLYIVYSNPAFPYRNINLNVGATGFSNTFTVPNLILPSTGPVAASVYLESVQGDMGYPDSLLLNGTTLAGPWNPANDFMNDKFVDYTSFALQSKGSLIVQTGSEYGYFADQTVIINNTALKNTDTQAVIRQVNTGDWAGVSLFGLAIDLLAANLGPVNKSVFPTTVAPGDIITYTINYTNDGTTSGINVTLIDTLPDGLTFLPNSLKVDGTSVPGDITVGITLPDLAPTNKTTIVFQAQVPSTPTSGTVYNNYATLNYLFNLTPTIPISNTAVSNISTATLVAPFFEVNKNVDNTIATVGNTITYSFNLYNYSGSTLTNGVFIDTIPSGTTLINNSFTINGVSSSLDPNPPGASIGSIPMGVTTISFEILVQSLPSPNPIINTAYITSNLGASIVNTSSNSVQTDINQAIIDNSNGGLTKSASPNPVGLGDTITYTITLTNTGNVSANNVFFSDTLPSGTILASGSLNPNPPSSISVGTIAAGATTTVTFQVVVTSLPASTTISNTGSVYYTYTVFPTIPDGASGSGNSNTTDTSAGQAIIDYSSGGLTKSATPNAVGFGDTITYTITLTNTGNTDANNVFFTDTLPPGTTLAPGSLNPNPPSSIPLGTIGVGQSATVTFQVVVTSLPSTGTVPNTGSINFTYTATPTMPDGVSSSGNTNTINTNVNQAIIDNSSGGMTKYASPSTVALGDTITYTITLTNTGNTDANNVFFIDTLPFGTTLAPGSLNPNPPSSIPIGTIGVGQSATVTFQVIVISLPASTTIPNTGSVSFVYTQDPSLPNGATGNGNSSTTNTSAGQAIIDYSSGGMTKSASPNAVGLGDTITYTITLTNTGNTNANNVFFTDTLPSGTTLAPGSLNPNPPSSISVGTIAPGATTTVTFKVIVTSLPATGTVPNTGSINFTYTATPTMPDGASGSGNSNTVNTNVNQAIIDYSSGGLTKSASPNAVGLGDTITYTITLTNTGNTDANNVFFTDTLPSGTTLAPGSLNPNPPGSIPLDTIGVGQSATVTFQVIVTSLPASTTIPNTGSVSFVYTQDPSLPNGAAGNGNSNTTNTNANQAIIDYASGGMTKSESPNPVGLGDTITYTITLTNTGNTDANNVFFTDTLPLGTILAPGSLDPNPPSSIPIGTIGVGQSATVTFQVVVVTLPISTTIPNTGSVSFVYTQDPSLPNGAAGNGNSNTTNTSAGQAIIDNASGGLTKSAYPNAVGLGDTITYTITLTNTGNTNANNVFFTDTLPTGTTLAQGSLNPNPPSSIPLGTIAPGATTTVTFKVIVTSLPSTGTVPNTGSINFTYTATPTMPDGASGSGNTNTINTNVNQAIINNSSGGMTKSASPSTVALGDTITYTITLTNTGNTPANNIFFTDTLPLGTILAPGSLNPNPPGSIPLGTIGVGQSATVTFQVVVVTLPISTTIPNTGSVNFVYTQDPSLPNGSTGNGNSNTINTSTGQAIIDNTSGGLTKSAYPNAVGLGDTITYTITLTNTGNTNANNVFFTDTLPSGTTLAQGSLNPNPPSSISVGTIAPGATTTVTFQVVVTSLPATGTVPNTGSINFTYTATPTMPDGASGSGNTNTINTNVNQAIINNSSGGMTKSASPSTVALGDTITYTITLTNTGNTNANNVFFTDTLPSGTILAPGSLNPSPPSSIPLGTIGAGQSTTVTFQVIVTSLPVSTTIPNTGSVNFVYTQDPSLPNGATGTGNSNTTNTSAGQAIIDNASGGLTKSASPSTVALGDTITYTITLTNTGNINANNVFFTDTLPSGTILAPGSLNPNPPSSIPIGTIGAGQSYTVTFQVIVTSLPVSTTISNTGSVRFVYTANPTMPDAATGNGNSNTVNTSASQAIIDYANGGFTKSASPNTVALGDTITYTITLTNTGNTNANNVFFTDTLPSGTILAPGSLNPNPPSSIPIGTIGAGQSHTVTFQVIVTSLPASTTIPNTGSVRFAYTANPTMPDAATGNGNSNTVNTSAGQAIIDYASGGMTKSASPNAVGLGDTITYTITLTNTGNTNANNVFFTDTLPSGTILAPGSLNPNPPSSIPIGTIGAGQSSTVTFKVIVTSLPASTTIVNIGNIKFTYTANPNNPNGVNGSGNSNIINTNAGQAIIDNSSGGLTKSASPNAVGLGDTITYTITLTNTGNTNANNVFFTDTLPSGTILAPGSLNPSPPSSIPIGTIGVGQSVTVTFQVIVTSLPVSTTIPNTGSVNFVYTQDPSLPNGATGNGNSNTTNTSAGQAIIDYASGGMTKYATPNAVGLGDTITYTITLTNTGNTNANNVFFTDNLPSETTLAPGSLNPNPPSSIPIGTIGAGQSSTVTFKVIVTSLPASTTIVNTGNIKFTYTANPNNPNGVNASGNSNIINTNAGQAIIDNASGGMTKSASPSTVALGDTITYTITLTNTGNTNANNVFFTDTLPSGTILAPGSLNPSPPSSIPIGTIGVGQSVTVTFQVIVTSLPVSTTISNTGSVNFVYTQDPSLPNGATGNGNSNTTNTSAGQAIIDYASGGFTKSASPNPAKLGDTITYTIILTNTGNTNANNVFFTDTLPSGTILAPGSLNPSPPSSIPVGTIAPGQSTAIAFKVILTSLPASTTIVNTGNIKFTYTANPNNPNGANGSGNSNIINTNAGQAIIDNSSGGFTKLSTPTSAQLGDTITYTISLTNTGNTPANNVFFTDTLPFGTKLATGSLNPNPPSSIPVGTIYPNATKEVTFQVIVTSLPISTTIANTGSINFTYTADPSIPNGNMGNGTSSTVINNISQAIIGGVTIPNKGFTKSVDKTVSKVGDILTYTITGTNTGNTAANKLIITDLLPKGTSYVVNSISSNVGIIGDPSTSITLINPLLPGENFIITYQVIINYQSSPNIAANTATIAYSYTIDPLVPNGGNSTGISNTTNTTVYNPQLTMKKSSDKSYVAVGDTLTYTILVTNTGDLPIGYPPSDSITIYDNLSSDLEFVTGSLTINEENYPTSVSISSINIGKLDIGESTTITFVVKVISNNISPLENMVVSKFGFQLPGLPPQSETTTSNTSTVTPEVVNINIVKTSDKDFAVLGDTINYTVKLTNTGTVDAINVLFKDILPEGINLINGSFTVNGNTIKNLNLASGVNIGNISQNTTVIIRYSVVVVEPNCSMQLINDASVKFYYLFPDNIMRTFISSPTPTSINIINLGISNFKQMTIDKYLEIQSQELDMENINNINGYIHIVSSYIVKTNKSSSIEGQNLSGYKLIVHGVLNEIIEYTACKDNQSMHSSSFSIPFSTFIILPETSNLNCNPKVEGIIENIYYKVINNRSFFTNATVLINVK